MTTQPKNTTASAGQNRENEHNEKFYAEREHVRQARPCGYCEHVQARLDRTGGVFTTGVHGNGLCQSPWHVHVDELPEYQQTAAERDRLLKECQAVTTECSQAIIDRDQAREQVKTLLAACKAALNDVNTANRLVFETLGATRSQAPIEATLSVTARELRAAIAAVESEGQ